MPKEVYANKLQHSKLIPLTDNKMKSWLKTALLGSAIVFFLERLLTVMSSGNICQLPAILKFLIPQGYVDCSTGIILTMVMALLFVGLSLAGIISLIGLIIENKP